MHAHLFLTDPSVCKRNHGTTQHVVGHAHSDHSRYKHLSSVYFNKPLVILFNLEVISVNVNETQDSPCKFS